VGRAKWIIVIGLAAAGSLAVGGAAQDKLAPLRVVQAERF
jgi:hypothetical protein